MTAASSIRQLLEEAVAEGVFPGAVLLVSRRGKTMLCHAVGSACVLPVQRPMSRHTLFDLASLTKPLATALAILTLATAEVLHLDSRLSELLPRHLVPADKSDITVRQLLCHCSGLPSWQPYYLTLQDLPMSARKTRLRELLLQEPLAHSPGSATVYSDLGYMLLDWLIELKTGLDLHRFTQQKLYSLLGCSTLAFLPVGSAAAHSGQDYAATEQCPWRGRVLVGEVHDENAYVVGGVCGHSGLFGTAQDIKWLLQALVDTIKSRGPFPLWSAELLATFLRPADLDPHSSWALGFDTPSSSGSSAGRYFSRRSIGHLGFTGTSMWLDMDREVAVILLSNRVHPTRKNDRIREFRPLLHDMVMEQYG
ncbi:MAG: serine hydrolase [Deltaproteobacteria bacterium]|nr:serine hydrolase [Deltaproteobacteria bacterium]MBW2071697.1 serine hydrolase [Deltaproteobacteria bacterium]